MPLLELILKVILKVTKDLLGRQLSIGLSDKSNLFATEIFQKIKFCYN